MVRSLHSVITMIAASFLTGTSAAAAQAMLGCPATATGSFVAEVRFDAGTTALGAYSITLTVGETTYYLVDKGSRTRSLTR